MHCMFAGGGRTSRTSPGQPPAVRRCQRSSVLAAAVLAGVFLATAGAAPARPVIHVAFSSAMMAGMNPSDAKAALDNWGRLLSQSNGLDVDIATDVYEHVGQVRAAIDVGRANVVLISVGQYRELGLARRGRLLFPVRGGSPEERVLLVSKTNGPIRRLADLRGRSLNVLDGVSHDMAAAWLDATLLEQGLGTAADLFARVTTVAKPAKTVLPVFFGQVDACLVPEGAFNTMVELNPQVGATLSPMATSVPLVHAVLVIDRTVSPDIQARMVEALSDLHRQTRGRQVLALFGQDAMQPGSEAGLKPTLDLLARLDRLRSARGRIQ